MKGRLVPAMLPGDQRAGVDAEAAVVEAHLCDEGDVVGGGEGLEAMVE